MNSHNHYALCPECERRMAELESVLADFVAWSAAPTPPLNPWLPDVVKAARRALSGAAQPRGEGARCEDLPWATVRCLECGQIIIVSHNGHRAGCSRIPPNGPQPAPPASGAPCREEEP